MKTSIVSSPKREVLVLKNLTLIYIPLNDMEKEKFAPNVIRPCWRIEYST